MSEPADSTQTPVEPTPSSVYVAKESAATLGRDLVNLVLGALQRLPARWDAMTEEQQNVTIVEVREAAHGFIGRAMFALYAGDVPAITASLGTVSFGDSIGAKVSVARRDPSRHQLADASGQAVVLLIVDPAKYMTGVEEIRAASKQGDLFAEAAKVAAAFEWKPPVGRSEPDLQPFELKSTGETPADESAGQDPASAAPGDAPDAVRGPESNLPMPADFSSDDQLRELAQAGFRLTLNELTQWTPPDRFLAVMFAIGCNRGHNTPVPDVLAGLPRDPRPYRGPVS